MNFLETVMGSFIPESIGNNLLLLDIDDTLLTAQGIKIWRKLPSDKKEVALTPDEYAKEKVTPETKKYYDYREFRDPEKVAQSIKTGIPIIPNLQTMDSYIKNGWKIGILTARGLENVIADSMKKWLMRKNEKGKLEQIGDKLVRELVFAINDSNKKYTGEGDFGKKANVIKRLAGEYDRIVFIDDDGKNIKAVKELIEKENLKNVVVREAKKSES